jgi:hypothetical protein
LNRAVTHLARPNGMELTGGPLRGAQPPHAGRQS